MDESLQYVQDRLLRHRGLWIRSTRPNNTGIGHTFEEVVLGKKEDNCTLSDLDGLEIKTKRSASNSMVTLFTKSPIHPPNATTTMLKIFGIVSGDESKAFHTTTTGKRVNVFYGGYGFRLRTSSADQKIYLDLYNSSGNLVVQKYPIYWTYDFFSWIIDKKIGNMGFVEAKSKVVDGVEYFMYENFALFRGATLSTFLDCINEGVIVYDIRMGLKDGGKFHDHGGGFRILRKNLGDLYQNVTFFDISGNELKLSTYLPDTP